MVAINAESLPADAGPYDIKNGGKVMLPHWQSGWRFCQPDRKELNQGPEPTVGVGTYKLELYDKNFDVHRIGYRLCIRL